MMCIQGSTCLPNVVHHLRTIPAFSYVSGCICTFCRCGSKPLPFVGTVSVFLGKHRKQGEIMLPFFSPSFEIFCRHLLKSLALGVVKAWTTLASPRSPFPPKYIRQNICKQRLTQLSASTPWPPLPSSGREESLWWQVPAGAGEKIPAQGSSSSWAAAYSREISGFNEQHLGTSFPSPCKRRGPKCVGSWDDSGWEGLWAPLLQPRGQSRISYEWAQGFIQLGLGNLQGQSAETLWTLVLLPDCPHGEKTFPNIQSERLLLSVILVPCEDLSSVVMLTPQGKPCPMSFCSAVSGQWNHTI